MCHINTLRNKLHESIERGNQKEILTISQELDAEIAKFMKKAIAHKNIKATGRTEALE